jgi:hypothetical protein
MAIYNLFWDLHTYGYLHWKEQSITPPIKIESMWTYCLYNRTSKMKGVYTKVDLYTVPDNFTPPKPDINTLIMWINVCACSASAVNCKTAMYPELSSYSSPTNPMASLQHSYSTVAVCKLNRGIVMRPCLSLLLSIWEDLEQNGMSRVWRGTNTRMKSVQIAGVTSQVSGTVRHMLATANVRILRSCAGWNYQWLLLSGKNRLLSTPSS